MSEFKREERYIVVKLKHLAGLQVAPLRNFLRENRVPTLDCVVVERDWPEYEKVWKSIERRMTGQPSEDFDRVTAERDAAMETVALKQRDLIEAQTAVTGWARKYDALQQRLTAADERADVLEGLLRDVREHPSVLEFSCVPNGWIAKRDAALKPAQVARGDQKCTATLKYFLNDSGITFACGTEFDGVPVLCDACKTVEGGGDE